MTDIYPDDPRVLAKRGDPATSHEAAEEIAGSELLGRMQQRACDWVTRHPGKTARELAELANDRDIRTINRRLNEIEQLGRVVRGEPRPCTHSGRRAHTWHPVAPEDVVPLAKKSPPSKRAIRMNDPRKTAHQQRVEELMAGYRQAIPVIPTMPNGKTRRLRARLILEEAFETVQALGFLMRDADTGALIQYEDLVFKPELEPNLVEIADGCADVSVVSIGTLSACGISDISLLEEVDANNLLKLKNTKWDEFGKGVKPEGHPPPDIEGVFQAQLFKA